MVIVPAFNEEAAIGGVVRSVRRILPGAPIFVIDDFSSDATARLAQEAGAKVVRLPAHRGLGECLRTGYRLAYEAGCDYAIRLDGDGQHEAADIPLMLEALTSNGTDAVIGSRFLTPGNWESPFARAVGIALFRRLLKPVLGKTVHDPTSGFIGVNRRALEVFSRDLPLHYPEIGGLMMLKRNRFRFHEISCRMHPRRTGCSSFTFTKSFHYTLHVLLGIFVNSVRFGIPIGPVARHGFEGE